MDESFRTEFDAIHFNFAVPITGSNGGWRQKIHIFNQFFFHCVVHNFSFKQFDKYTSLYVQSKHFFV